LPAASSRTLLTFSRGKCCPSAVRYHECIHI
jgi:hypothetical protein